MALSHLSDNYTKDNFSDINILIEAGVKTNLGRCLNLNDGWLQGITFVR